MNLLELKAVIIRRARDKDTPVMSLGHCYNCEDYPLTTYIWALLSRMLE
jgi:hypothetical protein